MYDVVIIGAGVVGCSIARELSKYKLKICVLEKESDVALGASKANSGIIHAGYDPKIGTLKSKLNVRGNNLFDKLSNELDFHFTRNGSLVMAFTDEEVENLKKLLKRGVQNGVQGLEILLPDEILNIEPAINKGIKAALLAPTGGITCPYEFTISLAENAMENGVEIMLENQVLSIIKETTGKFCISTNKQNICSKYVINAAGAFADEISNMVGAEEFQIEYRRGEYCLLDKQAGKIVSHTLFCAPGIMGKGILVTPTVDGNILLGPTAQIIKDKSETDTSADGLSEVIEGALKSVPQLPVKQIITSFAGVRAVSGDDFIIEESQRVEGFINVAGICSPGLTAAPAIAEYVSELLASAGLEMIENGSFNPYRKAIPRFRDMDNDSRRELIGQNALYGRIICRCEMITEGEIVEAIRRPCGACNLDAIKRRVRAGMGRCQGGFCSSRIVEILSRETGKPLVEITKSGEDSYILVQNTNPCNK